MPAYGGTLGHANSGTPVHMCACMTGKRGGGAPELLVRNLSVCQATCCPNPTSEDTDPFPLLKESLTLPVIGAGGPKEKVVVVRGEGSSCALLAQPKLFVALGAPLTELPVPPILIIVNG